VSIRDDSDPANWRIDASQDCIDLYLELANEARALTAQEASMMVELVDAWRAHEHRKHIALMEALSKLGSPD
jgi:hypothetical protein